VKIPKLSVYLSIMINIPKERKKKGTEKWYI